MYMVTRWETYTVSYTHLVVDYHHLNKRIAPEAVPLPDIHGAFHYFAQAKIFTVVDLNQAFHQIPLAE